MKANGTLLLILFIVVCGTAARAQDVIIMKSGERIEGTVVNIESEYVRYVPAGQPDSNDATVPIFLTTGIRYADNTIVSFLNMEHSVTVEELEETPENMNEWGYMDSYNHYYGENSGANAIAVTTLVLTPFVGLIPAITCAAITPSERNMNYPENAPVDNEAYKQAYRKQARKTKAKEVLTAYGESSLQWIEVFGKFFLVMVTLEWPSNTSYRYNFYGHRSSAGRAN